MSAHLSSVRYYRQTVHLEISESRQQKRHFFCYSSFEVILIEICCYNSSILKDNLIGRKTQYTTALLLGLAQLLLVDHCKENRYIDKKTLDDILIAN